MSISKSPKLTLVPPLRQHRLVAPTVRGGEVNLQSLESSVALLWFWAPWCKVCQSEAPAVATWAGGVIMLAYVIARRRRREVETRALPLGVRFSVVAIVALVIAALAGVALTVVILDSISELWTNSWGRLLILKVLLVSVAAAGGGYNHRVIVPELEQAPNDPELVNRLRTVVSIEAAALVAVTVVTAILIAASSS